MTKKNFIIFMTDQHSRKFLSCYRNPIVKTPNLDKLARKGVIFENASTNSPICVSARACFSTGIYVHQNKCWDNAIAYDGKIPSWGHYLQKNNIDVVSIGKLHFRSANDKTGFDEQILPMHIANGVGDVMGSIRPNLPERPQSRKFSEQIGPGETEYTKYDQNISRKAAEWLKARSKNNKKDNPFLLYVSFIAPHFPLIVPHKYYNLYKDIELPNFKKFNSELENHPWWIAFNKSITFDNYFRDDLHRREAIISYLGLCTFVDQLIGNVIDELESTSLQDNTNILFLSDHGENLGARGLWGKSVMYEESIGIPMILAGEGLPKGSVVKTPVSLIDVFPSILDVFGMNETYRYSGNSLFEIAKKEEDENRLVFSEYHGAGAISGAFMLRDGQYKYIHYVNFEPELYDLQSDPEELVNLATNNKFKEILKNYKNKLFRIVDPNAINNEALADQARLVEKNGGIEKVLMKGGLSGTPVPGGKSTRVEINT